MYKKQILFTLATTAASSMCLSTAASAASFTEALKSGKSDVSLRLRYESSEQDNPLEDATALTLRTTVGYTTGDYYGFSARVKAEDVRIVLDQDDFTVGPTGFNPGEFSVIADPETTEIDEGFVQYKNKEFSGRLGRQLVTYDGHRHIGSVAWRQDWQTFDAIKLDWSPAKNLHLSFAHLGQRNRIFAEAADFESSDTLLNASYKTSYGKFVGYGYFLDNEDNGQTHDTIGGSFKGKYKSSDSLTFLYGVELATQDFQVNDGPEFSADYTLLEGGVNVSGYTFKASYELLGSDDGAYGFSTPLATLHKFNGWADIFLNTPTVGLEDFYLTFSTKIAGGKFAVIYHDFSADEGSADLGDELDLLYAKKFGKIYNFGIKAAFYSQGDNAAPDTDKIWLWIGAKF